MGLARVAIAAGEPARARSYYEAALVVDPAAVPAHLGLSDLAPDAAQARAHLERALETAPRDAGALARLAEHTGRAPALAADLSGALALADAHPFDPRVLLDAGRRLAEVGRHAEARERLESALYLADLDPATLEGTIGWLRRVDPGWSARRPLPVHVFVDAPLRAEPGWRFRQRRHWREVSSALAPLLATRFVPVSFSSFDAAPEGATLDSRLRGLVYQTGSRQEPALFAGFTAEPTPRRPGAKRGIAAYLGRHVFLRDARGEPTLRVLAHELLHVYGGIHVAEDIDSLMNPGAESSNVDALNAEIVRLMAGRAFGPGGQEENVLPRIDLEAATTAYARALQVNLTFRESGVAELLGDAKVVGPGAWSSLQRAKGLDRHLADVSSFAARLYWSSERRVPAVAMLELAAELYGRQTPQGRAAWTQAEVLRRRLRFELGGGP